ncbi:MAG: ABC transporter permease [Lachnospiraceae bacterium]|nr:ABC transporter permease [Lachnospiraceae bacterium]MDD3795266.1 ABC transporter permease [Lachnospiraceae bacterium]
MSAEVKRKEPFIRMVKRDSMPLWKSVLIRIAAILISLVVCAFFIYLITHSNPVQVYRSMVDGAVGTGRRTWNTLRDTMILLATALAITPAFKMRFWNIGAEGQILVGGIVTAAVLRYCGESMPTAVLFLTMVAASLAAGMVWGLIPAIFKAKWNTNETLFTLMMNYIAIQLTSFFSIVWEAKKGSGTIGTINQKTQAGWISTKFLPDIFGNFNYSINVIIVIALTIGMFVYLKYTKQGYEISVVGQSENTARYAGINVKKVIMRTMAISGAICGFTGFLLVSGSSHTISTSTAGGRGFTAIIVSWLAKFNPFVMILISFFLVFMGNGATQIASEFQLNESASEVITGIILFFILGSEFFVNYKLVFGGHAKEGK